MLPGCGTQVVVTAAPGLSSRAEARSDSQGQWAVGSSSWTCLPLDCTPSVYGFLFWVGGSGPLPLGKPHKEPVSGTGPTVPKPQPRLAGLQGRRVLSRATDLAILVTAWPLPDPCLLQDQPQRLGRQPGPPFPAWRNKSAQRLARRLTQRVFGLRFGSTWLHLDVSKLASDLAQLVFK